MEVTIPCSYRSICFSFNKSLQRNRVFQENCLLISSPCEIFSTSLGWHINLELLVIFFFFTGPVGQIGCCNKERLQVVSSLKCFINYKCQFLSCNLKIAPIEVAVQLLSFFRKLWQTNQQTGGQLHFQSNAEIIKHHCINSQFVWHGVHF